MAAIQPRLKCLRSALFRRSLTCSRISRYSTDTSPRFVRSLRHNVENVEYYQPGGLHPISVGNCFAQDRYKVLHKVGFKPDGSFTLWLARDQGGENPGRLVTLKALSVDASDASNSELAVHKILQAANHPIPGIHTSDDHFFVDGPNGSHLFLVYTFAGSSVNAMSDCPGRVWGSKRLRVDLARKVIKQLVTALHGMHRAGVVHGDITILNILFRLQPHILEWTDNHVYAVLERPITQTVRTCDGSPLPSCVPRELTAAIEPDALTGSWFIEEDIILSGFGQSYAAGSRSSNYTHYTHMNYIPPEAYFEQWSTFEADVWALACAIFEIRAGFPLFPCVFRTYSDALVGMVHNLGRFPDPWWPQFEERSIWFIEDGEVKNFRGQEKPSIRKKLRWIGTKDEAPYSDEGPMIEKTGTRLSENEVELLGDLLGKMLRYRPEDRIGLPEIIKHPYLEMSA